MARHLTAALTGLATLFLTVAAGTQPVRPDAVYLAEYDGIIHPVAAEFFDNLIDRAEAADASLVVIVLRTPGGLLESTRTIVSRMIASRVPVAVFVSPSGSRAASAGFILTLAADVAAMAPGTHIGAAHPVSAGGEQQQPDSTMAEKAASDTAAYARTLAAARKRNVELAAAAVLESRAFTDEEARKADPPLIDLVARDVDDLLRQLHGRRITRMDGRTVTLATAGTAVERVEMTRRQRWLSALAHPQIAYLLLMLGMIGLMVEMWNPGSIAPGVVGAICLLLAFFAFQVLPVDVTGIVLVVLGAALLIAEIMVPSFGILGVGGVVALVAGAVMLVNSVPGLAVNYRVIVPVAIAAAVIVVVLGRLGLAAQRSRSITGSEGLIGEQGRVLAEVGPDRTGQVTVHGEIWRAISRQPLAPSAPIRVVGIDGLTLSVEPAEPSAPRKEST
jgi:membrane-bound serine protease (ClpP class)